MRSQKSWCDDGIVQALGPEAIEGAVQESGDISQAVVLIREALLLERDIGKFQGTEEEHGVLIVDVVISHSVIDHKVLASQILHQSQNTASFVSGLIVFSCRQAHVPLGVDRVVEHPRRDWSHRDATGKHVVGILFQDPEGVKAAIGPTLTHKRRVHPWSFNPRVKSKSTQIPVLSASM